MRKLSVLIPTILVSTTAIPMVSMVSCSKGNVEPGPGPSKEYLTFTATSDCEFYVSHTKSVTTRWSTPNLQYSINDGSWKQYTMPLNGKGKSIALKADDTIKFEGNNPDGFSYYDGNVNNFSYYELTFDNGDKGCGNISGNVMSLISGNDFESLTQIPSSGCFEHLFDRSDISDASNLDLPATTLTSYCYEDMFWGCTNLATGPKSLPAQELKPYCYEDMFNGCSVLAAAPEILATQLADESCNYMFYKCYKLKVRQEKNNSNEQGHIFTCPSTSGLENPVDNMFGECECVLEEGTPTEGNSYTSSNCDLCFEKGGEDTDPNPTIQYKVEGTIFDIDIQTSPDEINWTVWDGSPIELHNGEKLYVKNNNDYLSKDESNYFYFVTGDVGKVKASGFIDSMINYSKISQYCFTWMFKRCNNLITAPDFPAKELAKYCYSSMFFHCHSLTKAPLLSATKLAGYCYDHMFNECISLIKISKFPTAILAERCYNHMFYGCTSLKIEQKTPNQQNAIKEGFVISYSNGEVESTYRLMFGYTAGSFVGTPTVGHSYYWYDPVVEVKLQPVTSGDDIIILKSDTCDIDADLIYKLRIPFTGYDETRDFSNYGALYTADPKNLQSIFATDTVISKFTCDNAEIVYKDYGDKEQLLDNEYTYINTEEADCYWYGSKFDHTLDNTSNIEIELYFTAKPKQPICFVFANYLL